MNYPHLRLGLDEYCRYLQSTFKSNVQYRTGNLSRSIKVWCTVNNQSYSIHISLRNYWKWIPQPLPWNLAQITAGMPPSPIYTRYPQDTIGTRYPIDWSYWSNYLNQCLEKDIQDFLNG